eukprot:CAMPEP_0184713424 /NCGR_PEP_ID=MMETSP0314-20130426/3764_1 /TAXON_ID=38298 /ORGANISM="Rhodella maculata, Strain CCMP 736" /LENGTH=215 /DNA_ID=CAMNT_0027176065 /DNA_START=171 /DNA_END=815 /DNA_ORIENTATION=-
MPQAAHSLPAIAPAWHASTRGPASPPPFRAPAASLSVLSREALRGGLPRTLLRNIAAVPPPPASTPKRPRDDEFGFASPTDRLVTAPFADDYFRIARQAADFLGSTSMAPRLAAGPSVGPIPPTASPPPSPSLRAAAAPSTTNINTPDNTDLFNPTSSKRLLSLHCHVCTRAVAKLSHAVCGALGAGTCRKVVCARCFSGNGWDFEEATRGAEAW